MANVRVDLYPANFPVAEGAGQDWFGKVGAVGCVVGPVALTVAPFLIKFPPAAAVVGIVGAVGVLLCNASGQGGSEKNVAAEKAAAQIAKGLEAAQAQTEKAKVSDANPNG